MTFPAWKGRERITAWPPDDQDPMWQFQYREGGWVEVCGRDGTNWIRMNWDDWDRIVAEMARGERREAEER